MEVIADELKKNGLNIDIEMISEHINYILNNYRDKYNDSVNLLRFSSNEENMLNVFHKMDVNTPGRAMAYLTLVYRMSHILKEETVQKATRLAAPVLRNAGRVEASFIRNLCSWGAQTVLNLWDLM